MRGLELGTAWLHHMSFPSEKITIIPGRKIGLLMFACHSRSVCTAYVNALMTYLREPGVQRYANTYDDRQVGKTSDGEVKRSEPMKLSTQLYQKKVNYSKLFKNGSCYGHLVVIKMYNTFQSAVIHNSCWFHIWFYY